MHFLSKELEKYAEEHSSKEPEILAKLNRETHLKVLQPRMISGHLQGRVISMISKMVCPKIALEIGTYTGYSTICIAQGLSQNGILHTIDVNEELVEMQRKYFELSGYGDKIVQHLGKALDIIPNVEDGIDFVFIDADKKNYINYFDAVIEKMNKGGIILSDNVLWSGKVVQEVKSNDKQTQILMEYNKKLATDPRVETVLLPIRDGLTISRVR